jgi:type IV pilus assembly protein PilE
MNSVPIQRGFTLIELLIVMVVASILMMIAVPSYQQSVIKSRRADGRVALNDVAQRLERCYTQFGAYDADDCVIADAVASKDGFYEVTVERDASTYTLTAAPQGAQADDAKCGSLSVDNTGLRSADGDDPDSCW